MDLAAVDTTVLRHLKRETFPPVLSNLDNKKVSTRNCDDYFKIKNATIIMFNSVKSWKHFIIHCKIHCQFGRKFVRGFQLFVLWTEVTVEELTSKQMRQFLTQEHLKQYIEYLQFVVDEEHFIKPMTFIGFAAGKCKEFTLAEVNCFSKSSSEWKTSKFSEKRLETFDECELSVQTTSLSGIDFKSHDKTKTSTLSNKGKLSTDSQVRN